MSNHMVGGMERPLVHGRPVDARRGDDIKNAGINNRLAEKWEALLSTGSVNRCCWDKSRFVPS